MVIDNLYRAITATCRLFTPYSYAMASKIDWIDLERLAGNANTSEKMWTKMGQEVFWYHPQVRDSFFYELPGKNPSSKLLLVLLPLIAEGASGGISQDNYESLQHCPYFKESMFKSSGLFVDPDAE
jgi:hypothetical protein